MASAFTCMDSRIFFTFYVLVDIAIFGIVFWSGTTFIIYLKINWPQIFATIQVILRISLYCGLVPIIGRLFVACLNILKAFDDFQANDYNYPIFVFFYIFTVEVFPILCFGVFLNVQKQRITGNSQGGHSPESSSLDEEQGS